MKLKKKIFIGVGVVLVGGLGYGVNFGLEYAGIGSAYAAKTVCSDIFVSGRNFEDIKAEDLYAVSFATVKVDYENKSVTSNIYGIGEKTAIYRPGFGATLLNDGSAEELRKQSRPMVADTIQTKQEISHASIPGEIDSVQLYDAINKSFIETDSANIRRTRAIVVVYNGKIIAEKYAEKITENTPLIGWSMTKSVTNALVGILVKDGKLDIYKPAPVDEWKNDERSKITIDEMLRMSSGLDFEENYSKPCDATRMLFVNKSAGLYAINCKLKDKPGSTYYYSSGTTNILQEIIRRQFSNYSNYLSFPYNRLFLKLGMKSAVMEPDASGTFIGSSFMYATAEDWAKFGQLYLQDGIWGGERILPEGWVKYSATESKNSGGRYAAHFWVNHIDKEFPQDAFYADGYEGQFVTVIPSKNAVIVRLGCSRGTPFNNFELVKSILKAWK